MSRSAIGRMEMSRAKGARIENLAARQLVLCLDFARREWGTEEPDFVQEFAEAAVLQMSTAESRLGLAGFAVGVQAEQVVGQCLPTGRISIVGARKHTISVQ